jgi:hypothetical protein
MTARRLAAPLGHRVAPTMPFFVIGGREEAPRLAGASIPDFCGAYLEQRIDTARRSPG